jgi:NAD(P)-dependent dehydrogenase (short-subunit alcohol dehydrogenase family)
MSRMQNKTAIVTGGASGMGRATVQLLLAEGAQVLSVDRDEQLLAQLANEMNSPQLLTYVADLRQPQQIADYSKFALDRFGHVDAAIFNAGICGMNTPLEDYPEALFDEVLSINLKAVWLGMRAVVPSMKARRNGSIIFTSSIQGLAALPGTTPYTTSKHALVGMMKGAALELAPFNVRVNTVHPGYVATPMMDFIHKAVMPDAPEQFEAMIAKTVPMQRYAKAEEIAKLMLFLASEDSSYSTGACFAADGGILAALP